MEQTSVNTAWPSLRIGHITDLHARHFLPGSASVNKRRSRAMTEQFTRALAHLKTQKLDFIAITGDFVDVPEFILQPDDYYDYQPGPWIADAVRDYTHFKAILDQSGIPYMVLPGNHDFEPAFWQVFDRTQNTLDLNGVRVYRFCDREWSGHIPRRLDRERVLWLDALNNGPKFQLHLQHYVITPELNKGYPHTYLESEHFVKNAAASGKHIFSLSGHYHKSTPFHVHENAVFTTGPAFCDTPHPYRVYNLSPQGITIEHHTTLDPQNLPKRKPVFLDRDGVINTLPAYRTGPELMALIPGSAAAIKRLKDAGYTVVVITNQSAIGAGYVLDETVRAVNNKMCRLLVEEAGSIDAQPDAIYLEASAGETSIHAKLFDKSRAKPSPKMLLEAAELLNLDMTGAWMVGDSEFDYHAARAAGVTPILVQTGNGTKSLATLKTTGEDVNLKVVENLRAAVDVILGNA